MQNNPHKIKAVVDTNVLISALVFGGTPRQVTDMIPEKLFWPVMSEEILSELRRIILEKFPQFAAGLPLYEKLLRSYALWVPLGAKTVTVCRDPDDNKIIETALLGRCQYIISGDNDLLAIGTYNGIRILNPADFLDVFKRADSAHIER